RGRCILRVSGLERVRRDDRPDPGLQRRVADPMSGDSASAAATVLSLSAIRVTDLAKSTDFYTAGCGFAVEREFATAGFDAVILRAGAAGIELVAPRGDTESPQLGNMFVKLVLNTSDAPGLLARACRYGG